MRVCIRASSRNNWKLNYQTKNRLTFIILFTFYRIVDINCKFKSIFSFANRTKKKTSIALALQLSVRYMWTNDLLHFSYALRRCCVIFVVISHRKRLVAALFFYTLLYWFLWMMMANKIGEIYMIRNCFTRCLYAIVLCASTKWKPQIRSLPLKASHSNIFHAYAHTHTYDVDSLIHTCYPTGIMIRNRFWMPDWRSVISCALLSASKASLFRWMGQSFYLHLQHTDRTRTLFCIIL